jgi:hypothetical protein
LDIVPSAALMGGKMASEKGLFRWLGYRLHYGALLWRQKALSFWVALVSFLYTLFVVWRDEFASPAQQEHFRGINMLPDWSLSIWICIFLGLVCIWLFEASFRLHKNLRDSTAYGLHIGSLIPVLDLANPKNSFEVRLGIQNTTDFPIRYEVTELISEFGGHKSESNGPPAVIPARSPSTFFANSGMPKNLYTALPSRGTGKVTCKFKYGVAASGFSRQATKAWNVGYLKKKAGKDLNINWTVLDDRDEAI